MKVKIILAITLVALGLTSCSSNKENEANTSTLSRTNYLVMDSPGKTFIAIPTCSRILREYNSEDTLLYRTYLSKALNIQGVNAFSDAKVEDTGLDCILTTDKGEKYKVGFPLLENVRAGLKTVDNEYANEMVARGAILLTKMPTKILEENISYGSRESSFLEDCQTILMNPANGTDKRMKDYVLGSLKNGITKVNSTYITQELGNTCVINTNKGDFTVVPALMYEIKDGLRRLQRLNIQDEIKAGAIKIK